jgi:hypothetical protein
MLKEHTKKRRIIWQDKTTLEQRLYNLSPFVSLFVCLPLSHFDFEGPYTLSLNQYMSLNFFLVNQLENCVVVVLCCCCCCCCVVSLGCLALSYLGDFLSCVVMCNGCLVMSSFLLPTLLAYYFLFSFEMDCPTTCESYFHV